MYHVWFTIRTLQYFLLGTSLATILEIPSAVDCLRAMYSLIQEYDALTMSESKAKIVACPRFFRFWIRNSRFNCLSPDQSSSFFFFYFVDVSQEYWAPCAGWRKVV